VIRKPSTFLLAVFAMMSLVSIVSQAQPQLLLTHHVREAVLDGQAPAIGRLPGGQSMHFDIVLALRHQPELENFLQQLYEPSSSSYRRFLTPQEFTARFGPSQEDYDALIAFAKSNGFTIVGGSRDAFDVRFTAPVATIEKAFHVKMNVYSHPTENRTFYSPDREPTVNLPFQLWHVTGLDNYSLPRPALVKRDIKINPDATTGSCPGASFCGSDMRAAYYQGTALTGSGQNIGLLEFLGFDIADVNTYYKNAGQTRTAAVTGISTDGSSLNCTSPCNDLEQTIDITQSLGMAPGVTTVYLYVSNTSDTAMLSAMSTDVPLPLQLSSSWTWGPADPTADDPYFEKMASQGQSYFQAAGDSGAYTESAPWPANAAYVTTVGGTQLFTESAAGPWSSETTWVDGGGGWGSNVLIPTWQQLTGVITKTNDGSTTYRNVPDVSANAYWSFYVCANQQLTCTANNWGGTSFAAPMWAGYLALTNQQAAANGDPAPGFINPTIYPLGLGTGYGSDFHDIITGNNGFPALTGYDLATGWGSPNTDGLINALTSPAGPGFTLSATPGSLSVVEGASGTSTISVNALDGFTGSVTLNATGLPNGVTAGFSPNPTTTTSTLTLTASASATTGTATVTISGTSGSLSATTTVSLTVTPSGSGPAVSLSPASLKWNNPIAVGTTSATKAVVLTNTGSATLDISSIAASGDFRLVAFKATKAVTPCSNGSTVAAGASCTIKVAFTPTQSRTRTGDVTFTDNASNSPQQVPLSGIGK
jgi:kumamolisin